MTKYIVMISVFVLASLSAQGFAYDPDAVIAQNEKLRVSLDDSKSVKDVKEILEESLSALTTAWMGTPWGLGLPQTDRPGDVKINCGMFVGTLLVHLGLNVSHKKLQRQPAELIIKSLTKPDGIYRWRNKKITEFVDDVEALGDGWFVLGLDNHVGFIAVEKGTAWFVHADYVSGKVVKEPLVKSPSVRSSKYRVIGRLFQPHIIKAWKKRSRIRVIGKW